MNTRQTTGRGAASPAASTLADRLPALLPKIAIAIRGALPWLTTEELEDSLQDALVALLTRPDQDRLSSSSDSYVVQGAVYAARSWASRHRCYQQHRADVADAAAITDPTVLTEAVDDQEALQAFVRRLHGTTRAIAVGLVAGLGKKEACEAAGTVKGAFSYHRQRMAAALSAVDPDAPAHARHLYPHLD